MAASAPSGRDGAGRDRVLTVTVPETGINSTPRRPVVARVRVEDDGVRRHHRESSSYTTARRCDRVPGYGPIRYSPPSAELLRESTWRGGPALDRSRRTRSAPRAAIMESSTPVTRRCTRPSPRRPLPPVDSRPRSDARYSHTHGHPPRLFDSHPAAPSPLPAWPSVEPGSCRSTRLRQREFHRVRSRTPGRPTSLPGGRPAVLRPRSPTAWITEPPVPALPTDRLPGRFPSFSTHVGSTTRAVGPVPVRAGRATVRSPDIGGVGDPQSAFAFCTTPSTVVPAPGPA